MRVLNSIELVDLAIYTNNTLIFADFHIGYEESLNKQGIMVPRFQFPEVIKRLDNIFRKLKAKTIEKIIINGDLKHEFGAISDQEWRHTLKLLDYLGRHCREIVLIRGNHDTILGPIAKKRSIKAVGHYLIDPMVSSAIKKLPIINNPLKKIDISSKIGKILKNKAINNKKSINGKNGIGNKNKILVIHGNEIPKRGLLKGVSTIIIGHEHPAVSIKEGARTELFKAFLVGKWKGKGIIVQPSFNLVVEGTDVLKEEVLSPLLKGNLRNFDAVVVADKLYGFGKLKDL